MAGQLTVPLIRQILFIWVLAGTAVLVEERFYLMYQKHLLTQVLFQQMEKVMLAVMVPEAL